MQLWFVDGDLDRVWAAHATVMIDPAPRPGRAATVAVDFTPGGHISTAPPPPGGRAREGGLATG